MNKKKSAEAKEKKQQPASLNYVTIDPSSTAAWLEKYKKEQEKLKKQRESQTKWSYEYYNYCAII